jgi:hypothetical protein
MQYICHIWSIIVFHIVLTYSAKKTGTGGGKETKLNEIDPKVLEKKVSSNFSSDIILLNVPNHVTKSLTCSSTYIHYMDTKVSQTDCRMWNTS